MAYEALVSIGAYHLPEPSAYSGTTTTLADTARNTKGVLIGSVVRDDIASVKMSWNFISTADWAAILSKFSSAQGGSYINDVTFFCQDTGSRQTRKMYVSDRQASVCKRDREGNIIGYTDASLSLEEV